MGYTLYPPEHLGDIAARTALALAPLALVTIVSLRMGRGWFVAALPWVLVVAACAIYGGALRDLFAANGLAGTSLALAHLVGVVAPITVIACLAVLAVLGAKKRSNPSESA